MVADDRSGYPIPVAGIGHGRNDGRGDREAAEAWWREGLTLSLEVGDRRGAARCAERLGVIDLRDSALTDLTR